MRKTRKLTLHRETVRGLDEPLLGQIAAASIDNTGCTTGVTYCGNRCNPVWTFGALCATQNATCFCD